MKPNHDEIGVGATENLNLRVSAAALVRVLFEHPRDGEFVLALERKATLRDAESGRAVEIKSQPFGGAIRILNPSTIQDLIGDFHFDSERSRSEQDFRIFIRPVNWEVVRRFCIQHFSRDNDSVLETDPTRELAEEFADALKINLQPTQYVYRPAGFVVENDPAPTDNIHAQGHPTVRLYRIFEVHILDTSLCMTMLTNSDRYSDQELQQLALEDARNGGNGRANAVLTLPLNLITDAYLALQSEARLIPMAFAGHQLDVSVPAILEAVDIPQFQRL